MQNHQQWQGDRGDQSADTNVATSVRGVPIRLTEERWQHIIDGHEDLANYRQEVLEVVENPDGVYPGNRGSLIAVRSFGRRGFLGVFYREVSKQDGFIITARFLDKRPRRTPIWPKR